MFRLKDYQSRALDALQAYLQRARSLGAKMAFLYETDRSYHSVPQLPEVPYVCLRIPTGGGKTLMACHAVPIALHDFVRQERGVVLWLVPTNTIKEQTLNALRDPRHPYRQVLDVKLGESVVIVDLPEALSLRRHVLDDETVIIVCTVAALRVEDTEGRKVYEQSGDLISHFEGLPPALLEGLDRYENGRPIPSLANVLHLRSPIVIMDEAHHARTELSFETLARLNPACILEFTATPRQAPEPNPSNVLYHVSAYELKAESMVKLPLRLETRPDWKEALAAAAAKRAELEHYAAAEGDATGEYLRPIVLVQAQEKSQRRETLTVDVVRSCLLDLGVPPEQIAIETGERREAKKWEDEHRLTLFDISCPIRFIITIQALREGWDCSFAYVLCSVAEMGARTPVEQILGRILRLPRATRKQNDALNHSYAYVTSHRFSRAAQAVEGLVRGMEANGFTRFEASTEIYTPEPLPLGYLPLLAPLAGNKPTPAEAGKRLSVPQLALWVDDELEVVEEHHFLDDTWQLAKNDASLLEEEFPKEVASGLAVELDVTAQGRMESHFMGELQRRLNRLLPIETTAVEQLVIWLDKHIPHPDVTQADAHLFLLRVLQGLIRDRGFTLEQLARERFRLRDAVARKIEKNRRAVRRAAYQRVLFGEEADKVQVDARCVFTFDPNHYPTSTLYEGHRRFEKHYYRAIGAMNDEEAMCAQVIDSVSEVWVRNLERRPDFAFWLPTPTDRFYPDFVALLPDGRVAAIEYKGSHLLDTEDTREKQAIGNLWASRSCGTCIFWLVSERDFDSRLREVTQS